MKLTPLVRYVLVGLVILTALLGLIFATYIEGDHTNKYSGEEKVAAQTAIKAERYASQISPMPEFLRTIQVVKVRKINAAEQQQYCSWYKASDPSYPSYLATYVVTLKIHNLFDFGSKTVEEYGCYFSSEYKN